MTIKDFIKELEAKAKEAGTLDKDIISIGTGMNTTDNYYVINTKDAAIQIIYNTCE